MSNVVELRTADSITTQGVSLNDFERAYLGTKTHKRLRLEDDIITTFRASSKFGIGGYTTFRVYGTVTDEQVAAVATWGKSMNMNVEYQTTNNGRTFKYLTGADWVVAL